MGLDFDSRSAKDLDQKVTGDGHGRAVFDGRHLGSSHARSLDYFSDGLKWRSVKRATATC